MLYRMREKQYEAFVFDGDAAALRDWLGARYVTTYASGLVNVAPMVVVHSPSGSPQLSVGDVIVRNVAESSDFAVYGKDSFATQFAPVPDEPGSVTIAVDPIAGGTGVSKS